LEVKQNTGKYNYNLALKDYRQSILQAKADWYKNRILDSDNKAKESWNIVNEWRVSNNNQHKNISLVVEGNLERNPKKTSEMFNTYFCNVGVEIHNSLSSLNRLSIQTAPVGDSCFSQFKQIDELSLSTILSGFKGKTSSGIDGISMKVLKACQSNLMKPLVHLVNVSIMGGTFPEGCKIAKVRPLFKKGSEGEVCNYRPISLLPVVSKLIEKVACDQLTHYLEANNLLCGRQYGFRKKKSTKLALIDFVNDCIEAMDAGETVLGCFTDLSKAFDCVDPNLLLQKLAKLGIRATVLGWIKSYLSNRMQITEVLHETKFKIKSVLSRPKNIPCGVPQGSILGPLLFLVYINDITEKIPESNLFVFADDTTIISRDRCINLLEIDANIKINEAAQFFSENKLKLNPEKTQYVCLQTHQRANSKFSRTPNISIGDVELESVSSVDFLGVRLDGGLSWGEQLDRIECKLARGIFVLKNLAKFQNLDLLLSVYYCLLQSHISYSIILWGATESNLKRIFTWQKKALRGLLRLPRSSHCKDHFIRLGLLTVPCLYILEVSVYIKSNSNTLLHNNQHNYNTRFKNNFAVYHSLSLFEKTPKYAGLKIFKALPSYITEIHSINRFKLALKNFLIEKCFYNLGEFYDFCCPNPRFSPSPT